MSPAVVGGSIALFAIAALLEIGGGWLVWQWLREGAAPWVGAAGGAALVAYGVVPTFQPASFGRVYAAYGGVFVVGSLLWGWRIDGHAPDFPDLLGAALCLAGMGILMYAPRG